jgi:hypothetical protein
MSLTKLSLAGKYKIIRPLVTVIRRILGSFILLGFGGAVIVCRPAVYGRPAFESGSEPQKRSLY